MSRELKTFWCLNILLYDYCKPHTLDGEMRCSAVHSLATEMEEIDQYTSSVSSLLAFRGYTSFGLNSRVVIHRQ